MLRPDRPHRLRTWRRLLVCLAIFPLVGCGSFLQLAYNNADWAVRLSIDDYLAPDGAQQPLARDAIATFHRWHRRVELPQYAELLESLGARVAAGTSEDDVRWALANASARYYAATAQAVREARALVDSLHAENFVAMERKFESDNDKYRREFLGRDESRRHAARLSSIEKRFAEWLGELSEPQRTRIAAFARSTPSAADSWFSERQVRQRRFLALLRDHRGTPELGERIVRFLGPAERFQSAGRAEMTREWEIQFAKLVVDIDRMANAAQREHAVQRAARWAADFRALAREGGS